MDGIWSGFPYTFITAILLDLTTIYEYHLLSE